MSVFSPGMQTPVKRREQLAAPVADQFSPVALDLAHDTRSQVEALHERIALLTTELVDSQESERLSHNHIDNLGEQIKAMKIEERALRLTESRKFQAVDTRRARAEHKEQELAGLLKVEISKNGRLDESIKTATRSIEVLQAAKAREQQTAQAVQARHQQEMSREKAQHGKVLEGFLSLIGGLPHEEEIDSLPVITSAFVGRQLAEYVTTDSEGERSSWVNDLLNKTICVSRLI